MTATEPTAHEHQTTYQIATPEQIQWETDDSRALAAVITSQIAAGLDIVNKTSDLGGDIQALKAVGVLDSLRRLMLEKFNAILSHDGEDGFTRFEKALETELDEHLANTPPSSWRDRFSLSLDYSNWTQAEVRRLYKADHNKDTRSLDEICDSRGNLLVIVKAYVKAFKTIHRHEQGPQEETNKNFWGGLDALAELLPAKEATMLKNDGSIITARGYPADSNVVWRGPEPVLDYTGDGSEGGIIGLVDPAIGEPVDGDWDEIDRDL